MSASGFPPRENRRLEITFPDVPVGEVVRGNERGVLPFRLGTPGFAGRTGTIELRITSPDDHWRNFFFEAWTEGP